jgi:hypothetical protein
MQSKMKLAGLDIPGDITVPCETIAAWVAHLHDAPWVDIADFLTAAYIILQSLLGRYCQDEDVCRVYFQRRKLPDEDRETLIADARNWLCACTFQLPFAGRVLFGQIRDAENRLPRSSEPLRKLITESHEIAISNGLDFPIIECVLISLLDNPSYGESQALRDSGIDENLVRNAVKEKRYAFNQ